MLIDGINFGNSAQDIGDLIPDVDNTRSLGSASRMWQDVFVGPGSLYVNGQKVLEESAGTIVLSADSDQNIQIKPTGAGDIEFYPSGTGVIQMKGTLQIQAGDNITSSDANPISVAVGFNMSGEEITNLAEPTTASSAATKQYVDNAVPNFQTSTHLGTVDDLDTLNDGVYDWTGTLPTNAPELYMVMNQTSDANQKIQMAWGTSSSGEIYVRRADSGTFYAWTKFLNENSVVSGTVLQSGELSSGTDFNMPASESNIAEAINITPVSNTSTLYVFATITIDAIDSDAPATSAYARLKYYTGSAYGAASQWKYSLISVGGSTSTRIYNSISANTKVTQSQRRSDTNNWYVRWQGYEPAGEAGIAKSAEYIWMEIED